MAVTPRYLLPPVRSDLERKMVFVAGPRQVGKTTLAKSFPGAAEGYLNWDVAEHRERILRRELPVGNCGSSTKYTSTDPGAGSSRGFSMAGRAASTSW